jgi:cytochrome c
MIADRTELATGWGADGRKTVMQAARLATFAVLVSFMTTGCSPKQETIDPRVLNLPLPGEKAIAAIASQAAPYNTGDAVQGRAQFGDCAGCHSVSAKGPRDKGPSLYGVFGQPAAIDNAFPYSEALRSSGLVWDAKHLDQWIFNPHEMLPGTTMVYVGIRNDARRRNVIAYLIALANDAE